MSDRVIINTNIIELELMRVVIDDGRDHFSIRIMRDGGTEAKSYSAGVTDSLRESTIPAKLSKFHNDFIYWLLRRLFIKRYQEEGTELKGPVELGSGNYESLIGISVSKDEALITLLRMIRMFVEDDSERPIDLLELFLSCELHFNVIQNAINDASKLHKLIERRGINQVHLIDGQFDALNDRIYKLENSGSVSPMKFFHEVEISLTPPFGFILMPFKDKKGFKQSVYKKHIIPHIKEHYGIQCYDVRGSKIPNFVGNKIFTCIKKSDFVIADITGYNANVFYELGIVHHMERVNIVVGKALYEKLPFDLNMFECDEYSTIKELKKIIDSRLPSIMKRNS